MFARQRAAALMEIKNEVEASGAKIVMIGSGTPEQAKKFATNFKIEIPIYVDPSLQTYKAFLLKRGFFKTLGWKSLMTGLSTLKSGFRQGLNAGDLWQQGGVFVMGPGKQILYQHVEEYAGEPLDKDAVLQACKETVPTPSTVAPATGNTAAPTEEKTVVPPAGSTVKP
jgi:hypothetical protein